jgi:hypothetical protein
MKKLLPFLSFSLLLVAIAATLSFQAASTNAATLKGAWQLEGAPDDHIVIFTDEYFSYARYDKAGKQFLITFGGTYKTANGQIEARFEYNTGDSTQVGQAFSYPFTLSNDELAIIVNGETSNWERLDDGTAPLAGNWRITGRMQDGKIQAIHQAGGRKTVKILSGTRFQWAAVNTDTKEFFGTGGGTYTFQNGKYTENIEFFSRDNSRVGASLTFDGAIKSDGWHHSGLSSRGDKIYEVWNKTK